MPVGAHLDADLAARGVYLAELLSRFANTCARRTGSASSDQRLVGMSTLPPPSLWRAPSISG
jgi:hypothetical protein